MTRFRPRGQEDLAPSGAIARVRANLAALQTLRRVQAEHRPATPDEQALLARWSGWGAVPAVLDANSRQYEQFGWAREQLAELMSLDELAAAARNTLNAHYTDAALVEAIWGGVRALGFTGGRVLEPGCGVGTFIAYAPEQADVVGVELEPVTAAIAGLLHPHAQILGESFADTRAPEGHFDLVIGNVPFGNAKLHDPRHNRSGHSIHHHFILKGLHLARPGGLVAVVTSMYTMDQVAPAARREMAQLADLVGAVRLPAGAHRRAAGTDAVTDLLVLRRREPDREPDPDTAWELSRPVTVNGAQLRVNDYFLNNPDRVLGEFSTGDGLYRDDELTVVGDRDGAPAALATALESIAAQAAGRGLLMGAPPATPVPPRPAALVATGQRRPDGYIQAHPDGTFTRLEDGIEVPHTPPATQHSELRALLRLRDITVGLLEAEAASMDDTADIDRLRHQLNETYDAYAASYGPINRFTLRRTGRTDPDTGEEKYARIFPPQGGFTADPYHNVVCALEDFDPASQQASKMAVFTQRVVAPRAPRLGADTPEDALAICLDTHGEVRLGEIARLLGVEEPEARAQLGTLVFDDPQQDGKLVPAPEYLSGPVRTKLSAARDAALDDPRYAPNVTALGKVIPRDLTPAEIEARLGATWIDPKYVREFLAEILDDPSIKVDRRGDMWAVRSARRRSVRATSRWGTPSAPAPSLALAMLEQRPIRVYDTIPPDDKRVFNAEKTAAAQQKADELAERFAEWVWEQPQRAAELAAHYNEKFNNLVLRSYEGARPSLPGLAMSFRPFPHQLAAVARVLNEPSVGLFHEVGAGKTSTMVMAAMELRRLGLANKPAIVVPNHMLEQFQREALQLYPQARILAASTADLSKERRRRFVGQITTGDWDFVIMTRGAFEKLPMAKPTVQAYLHRQVEELAEAIQSARGEDNKLLLKRLEGAKLRAEERLKKILDGYKDPGITFEQTGIDYLFVDEAHWAKNLFTPSNIPDMAVVGKKASQRASDLHMKLEWLRSRNERVATLATATPIANSMGEAYTMLRYLRPDLLEDLGITSFDRFAATFGKVVTDIEVAPDGTGLRTKSRFASFVNVPELLRPWHVAGDIKTADDLQLDVPQLAARSEDGQRQPETIVVPASEELKAYIATFIDRADRIRTGAVHPSEDNFLKIATDGRSAALDLRLVASTTQPTLTFPSGETAPAAEQREGSASLGEAALLVEEEWNIPVTEQDLTGAFDEVLANPAVREAALTEDREGFRIVFTDAFESVVTANPDATGQFGRWYLSVEPYPGELSFYHPREIVNRNLAGLARWTIRDQEGVSAPSAEPAPAIVATNPETDRPEAKEQNQAEPVPPYPTEPGKLDVAADQITAIWQQHRETTYLDPDGNPHPRTGALQLVFADLGTPANNRWNVYDELREQLVARGMPHEQVRFVHEAGDDPRKKEELFAACRDGQVAVLIGSTEKMGVGTNVQARAVALHHLDCPWRPADVQQREGRIIRQRNQNPEVRILRYVTEGSFDGFTWGTVTRKAQFIAQVMRGKLDVREIEDIGDATLSYNEVKALATGNPLLLDQAEAKAEVTRLERLERAHHRNLDTMRYTISEVATSIRYLQDRVTSAEAAIAGRVPTRGDAFRIDIGGTSFTDRSTAAAALRTKLQQLLTDQRMFGSRGRSIGRLGGFDIEAAVSRDGRGHATVTVELVNVPLGALVNLTPMEVAKADLVARLENRLHNLENVRDHARQDIAAKQTEIDQAQQQLDAPFKHVDALEAARARLAEVEAQLAMEADDRPRSSANSADKPAAEAAVAGLSATLDRTRHESGADSPLPASASATTNPIGGQAEPAATAAGAGGLQPPASAAADLTAVEAANPPAAVAASPASLSPLVAQLNQRHGTSIPEADLTAVFEQVIATIEVRQAARANYLDNFRLVFDRCFDDAMVTASQDHLGDLTRRYFNDPGFRGDLHEQAGSLAWQTIRAQNAQTAPTEADRRRDRLVARLRALAEQTEGQPNQLESPAQLRRLADEPQELLVSDDERYFASLGGGWLSKSWEIREATTGVLLIPPGRGIKTEQQAQAAFTALSASGVDLAAALKAQFRGEHRDRAAVALFQAHKAAGVLNDAELRVGEAEVRSLTANQPQGTSQPAGRPSAPAPAGQPQRDAETGATSTASPAGEASAARPAPPRIDADQRLDRLATRLRARAEATAADPSPIVDPAALRSMADELLMLVSDDERFFARLDGTWTGQTWEIREATTGALLIGAEGEIRSQEQVERAFAALSGSDVDFGSAVLSRFGGQYREPAQAAIRQARQATGVPAHQPDQPASAGGQDEPAQADPRLSPPGPTPAPATPQGTTATAPKPPAAATASAEPVRVELDGVSVLVKGTSKQDTVVRKALKDAGFRWSGRLDAWWLPRNLLEHTRRRKIGEFTASMRRAGREIPVIDHAANRVNSPTSSPADTARMSFPSTPPGSPATPAAWAEPDKPSNPAALARTASSAQKLSPIPNNPRDHTTVFDILPFAAAGARRPRPTNGNGR